MPQFVSDWIDAFLRVMNEGEQQNETDTIQQRTDTETSTPRPTGIPGGTGGGRPSGTSNVVDTGDVPETPSATGTVAPTAEQTGATGDADSPAEGDTDVLPADAPGSAVTKAQIEEITGTFVDDAAIL